MTVLADAEEKSTSWTETRIYRDNQTQRQAYSPLPPSKIFASFLLFFFLFFLFLPQKKTMVFLVITSQIISALEAYRTLGTSEDDGHDLPVSCKVGDSIHHDQLITLSRRLKKSSMYSNSPEYELNTLLRGTTICTPAPEPLLQVG